MLRNISTWSEKWHTLLQASLPCLQCTSCGTLTMTSGTFSSGFISNHANCKWLISPRSATHVTITFTEFRTELGFDTISVFQCPDETCSLNSRRQLAQLSGSALDIRSFTSFTGYMLVHAVTDSAISSAGFSATWTSNGPTPVCSLPDHELVCVRVCVSLQDPKIPISVSASCICICI